MQYYLLVFLPTSVNTDFLKAKLKNSCMCQLTNN